ncbi:MAG: isoaspartyl peptidase/L-asparaginase [Chloracidobacterium sp.]|nr:isoaspartyl peptidase/L-asparaginase [Chloracidobacterium sp.]
MTRKNTKFKDLFVAVVLFALVLPITVFAQKGGYPEIKQLQSPQNPRIGFLIHGGAGSMKKGSLTPAKEKEYRDKLTEALLAGYKALQDGKSSLDAVEIAIRMMEDSPLFNAGKGAVFNADGKNELDASIMNGKTLAAGGAAGLHHVKNPITLARAVMEKSPHVFMFGNGAEIFAKEQKIEMVDEKYFWTQESWDAFQKLRQLEKDQKPSEPKKVSELNDGYSEKAKKVYGTVGAVALDKEGNLSAGTSTGGMDNKKYGRVGDAPIIGAGTYANNNTCAVSATGWGEYFIRLGVARDISALMEYRALTVQAAADAVIKQKLQKLGGNGGVIAMDKFGNMAISFNTDGMFRAYVGGDGKPVVEIYKD